MSVDPAMPRPTHLHRPTGNAVFPAGYAKRDLKPLPKGFWIEADRQHLVSAIRAEAARRCEAIASPARQLNDIREPSEAGAARFAAIDAVRAWSNALQDEARAASSDEQIAALHGRLLKGPQA